MLKFILVFLFLTASNLKAQSVAGAYIAKFDSLAVEVLNVYGIPASLVLGLALQESAAGTSKICKSKHNHFGLKGRVKSSKTKSGYTTTFLKFETDEECYLYFGDMISKRKYYADLKGNMNYLKWLKAMKSAGYASSSSWISHVDKMIKRYDLTRFDVPANASPVPTLSDTITSPQE
jgi:flagellum-specific peptidoglycan hydrolase FlgJ